MHELFKKVILRRFKRDFWDGRGEKQGKSKITQERH